MRRTWTAVFIGGTLGAIIGLAVVALAAGRVVGSGIESVAVLNEPARATFVVSQAGLYVLILVASAAGGAVLAVLGFAVGRMAAPQDERFPASTLAVVGAVVGAIVGFAAARTAVGIGGVISQGVVSLSVFRAAIVAIVTGATTGAILSGSAERLAKPDVLGFEGEAWPSDTRAFLRDAAAAVGLPVLGILLGIGAVFALSQVLLEADHLTAIVTFGGVAALVLFGAAAIAALGSREHQ